ncbi:hypothetical protein QR685DRAFT_575245 [Neurospora intermedia]|uniref:Uncharacterized protein n=1 Tax=Neurospora intermedia TaxID=5142 RepID=A0ABR3D1N3_NEUIN
MGWLQSGLGYRRTLQTIEIAIPDASVLPDALRESTVDSRFSLFSDSCHFVFHYSSDPESVDRLPLPPLSVRVQYANRSLERHALYIADHSGSSKIARKRLGNINKSSRYCTAHPAASSVRSKPGSQTATRSQSVFIWYALCVRREQSTDRPALDLSETNLSGSGLHEARTGPPFRCSGERRLKRGGAVGGVSFDSYKHLHVRAGDGRDYRGFPSRVSGLHARVEKSIYLCSSSVSCVVCVLHSLPFITVGILFQFANGTLASEWWCSKEWSFFHQAIPVQVKLEFHGSIVE